MSAKLRRLAERMGDLVARRAELRFRVAQMARYDNQGALAVDAVNEIAHLSEEIGELKVAIGDEQGRIGKAQREGRTEPEHRTFNIEHPTSREEKRVCERSETEGVQMEDLALHSGPCVECGESRDLDANGRCGLCEIMVAAPTA